MRVDIETVIEIQRKRKKINSQKLEEIEWFKDGKKIEVQAELIEGWKFSGLNNIDFAECHRERLAL